ncbi:MAG: hypothetical protein J0H36_11550 [Hyphomicrobium denitrificans]|nr:hypothetical protein [Hyphomicrobium denitrificans]
MLQQAGQAQGQEAPQFPGPWDGIERVVRQRQAMNIVELSLGVEVLEQARSFHGKERAIFSLTDNITGTSINTPTGAAPE